MLSPSTPGDDRAPIPTPGDLGRRYDRLYQRSPFQDSPDFYRWVLERARPEADQPVLDVGCGVGGALRAAARVGALPYGVDLSREALRRARENVGRGTLVVADGACLPFADGTFPLVLCLGTLEHCADLRGAVREMARILTPDGVAWVLLPNLFYSGAIWKAVRTGYGPDHHQPIDRFATVNEWRDLLQAGGLRVRRWVPYHKGKRWKRLLPRSLAWHFLFEATPGEGPGRDALPPLERMRPDDPR